MAERQKEASTPRSICGHPAEKAPDIGPKISTTFNNAEDPPSSPERTINFEVQEDNEERAIVYLEGWRLHTLTAACDDPITCYNGDTADVALVYASVFSYRL